jgi:predicted nuclease of predicted toxin-antitoxin system
VSRRFKLDENLPRDAEELFLAAGHDVETVLSERLGGEPDRKVIEVSRAEDRILVTLDVDFADFASTHRASFRAFGPFELSHRRSKAFYRYFGERLQS